MPPTPRPPPTHFLCIPLAGPQIANSLAAFKADVTSKNSNQQHAAPRATPSSSSSTAAPAFVPFPEQAIRPPSTIHLTLGVLSLKDDTTLTRAVTLLRRLPLRDLLQESRATSDAAVSPAARAMGLEPPPPPTDGGSSLSVTLRGVQAMQSPSKTSVLYAPPVDPGGLLRRFCEGIRGVFMGEGLMTEEGRPLLLHATIVNTIYVKGRGSKEKGRGGRRERLMVDARDVISRYGDHVWLENMPVTKVSLCRMGAKKMREEESLVEGDEAYEVEAEVGLVE